MYTNAYTQTAQKADVLDNIQEGKGWIKVTLIGYIMIIIAA